MKEIVLRNDVASEQLHHLEAGNFSALYETGRLRYINYSGHEILRMIYPALRSEDWTTIKGEIRDEKITVGENGFSISYKINFNDAVIKYRTEIEIASSGNTIEYIMKGEALSDFKSKRIGLCVHHPIPSCSGRQVLITHSEEREATYVFPELISPVWPFTDIQKMKWRTGNADVELNFEGDLFETEDQRNWTDDSYKTYSGPQYKTPMLDIKKGDTMRHHITLKVSEIRYAFPKIGYSRGSEQPELTSNHVKLLQQIPFDHYRVEIDLSDSKWKDILDRSKREARILNTRIELVIKCLSAPGEELISQIDDLVESVLVISENYAEVHEIIKDNFPGLPVGFGKDGWFADLNGSDLEDLHFDFTAFLVSPQVHQNDNLSIMENLGSQHATIQTLKSRVNKPVHVSPIVFNTREKDARLHSSFAAWWTINAIYNFAAAGYLTLYELTGDRGILHDENNPSPLFELLRSLKQFQPVYIFKNKNAEIVLENADNDQLIVKKKS